MLVVEDDPNVLIALQTLFTRRGWEVTLAENLEDALSRLDLAFHYVVLDIMLPDGSGERVLEAIRAQGLPVRVVVTTAVGDEAMLETIRQLEPDALLQKPISFQNLLAVLEGEAEGGS